MLDVTVAAFHGGIRQMAPCGSVRPAGFAKLPGKGCVMRPNAGGWFADQKSDSVTVFIINAGTGEPGVTGQELNPARRIFLLCGKDSCRSHFSPAYSEPIYLPLCFMAWRRNDGS